MSQQLVLRHPGVVIGKPFFSSITANPSDPVYVAGIKHLRDAIAKRGEACGGASLVVKCVDIGPYGVGKGHDEFTGDCMQAHRYAILFVATKEEQAAKSAIDIIKAWSVGCVSFTGANAPLECGWGGAAMIRSAELLKHTYAGWNASGVEPLLTAFIDKILMPNLLGRYKEIFFYANNWSLTILEALAQIYIYHNNSERYLWTLSEYRKLAPKTFVGSLGKNTDSHRDQIHSQFNLMGHIQFCEIAWNQGIDLYKEVPILQKSVEYIASILNGKQPPDTLREELTQVWFMPSAWDVAYNHYVHHQNQCMPELAMLLSKPGHRPEGQSFNWGPSWAFQKPSV